MHQYVQIRNHFYQCIPILLTIAVTRLKSMRKYMIVTHLLNVFDMCRFNPNWLLMAELGGFCSRSGFSSALLNKNCKRSPERCDSCIIQSKIVAYILYQLFSYSVCDHATANVWHGVTPYTLRVTRWQTQIVRKFAEYRMSTDMNTGKCQILFVETQYDIRLPLCHPQIIRRTFAV